jgi:RNA polymerase sigma factor (sigma-70 family)
MLNHVRSSWRRRRIVRQDPVPVVPEARETSLGPVDTSGPLRGALRSLPPGQRAVLYLRFCEDLSEAETARLLGCAVGTVKSQAHAGLRRLRASMPSLLNDADRDADSEVGE